MEMDLSNPKAGWTSSDFDTMMQNVSRLTSLYSSRPHSGFTVLKSKVTHDDWPGNYDVIEIEDDNKKEDMEIEISSTPRAKLAGLKDKANWFTVCRRAGGNEAGVESTRTRAERSQRSIMAVLTMRRVRQSIGIGGINGRF